MIDAQDTGICALMISFIGACDGAPDLTAPVAVASLKRTRAGAADLDHPELSARFEDADLRLRAASMRNRKV